MEYSEDRLTIIPSPHDLARFEIKDTTSSHLLSNKSTIDSAGHLGQSSNRNLLQATSLLGNDDLPLLSTIMHIQAMYSSRTHQYNTPSQEVPKHTPSAQNAQARPRLPMTQPPPRAHMPPPLGNPAPPRSHQPALENLLTEAPPLPRFFSPAEPWRTASAPPRRRVRTA